MMAFITHFCKKINLLLGGLLLLLAIGHIQADEIGVIHAKGAISKEGQMLVSTRFNVDIPSQLNSALLQGVSLNFRLSFSLDAPTYTSYKNKVDNWFSEANSLTYKLSYHPLTKRYRVSLGGFVTEHTTLRAALNSIGGISNWKLLPKNTLRGVSAKDAKASVRLSLTMDDLPKPFQINGLTLKKWNLDTNWVYLSISEER